MNDQICRIDYLRTARTLQLLNPFYFKEVCETFLLNQHEENAGFSSKKKLTRREHFLALIGAITPWLALVEALFSYYTKEAGRASPETGLKRTLCMYIIQQCLELSDEGMEESIYDSQLINAGCQDIAEISLPIGTIHRMWI